VHGSLARTCRVSFVFAPSLFWVTLTPFERSRRRFSKYEESISLAIASPILPQVHVSRVVAASADNRTPKLSRGVPVRGSFLRIRMSGSRYLVAPPPRFPSSGPRLVFGYRGLSPGTRNDGQLSCSIRPRTALPSHCLLVGHRRPCPYHHDGRGVHANNLCVWVNPKGP